MERLRHESLPLWLHQVLEGARCAFVAMGRHGIIRTVMAPSRHLLAVDPAAAAGRPLSSLLTLLDPETRSELKIPTPRAFLRDPTPRHFTRSILVNASGREFVVDAILSPILGDKGRLEGSVLMLQDVGLTVAHERITLDRKMIDAVGSLASSMAHDFGNYLGIISGHASSIAENLIPQTHAHEEALRILTTANQAGDLTKRLLNLAKTSHPEQSAPTGEVNLAEIVADAITVTQNGRSQPAVNFNLRNIHRMQAVQAEPSQLLDCLVNLIQNAQDAIRDGGTITIEAAEKRDNGRRYVSLRVSDTGCGIPREHLGRIFEPFFSTKKSSSALGLGLTVVRNTVEWWGGQVKVRSRPGHGATFTLLLPRAKTQRRHPRKPQPSSGTETILVADDSPSVLAECAAILDAEGYRVLAASSGEECIALYRQNAGAVNLTIIDAVLPGQSAKNALQEILKLDPTAPVIMASGFSRDYVRTHLQVGAWGFIQKPFDAPQLVSAVRRSLDQKRVDRDAASRERRKDTPS